MRALLLVLDSLGVGGATPTGFPAPHSLGRIFNDVPGLKLPALFGLGLGEILNGRVFDPPARAFGASYGRMIQRSAGADGLSSLWELAGVVLGCPFAAFERLPPAFIAAIAPESGVEFLVNPSPRPPIPAELRDQHLQTGRPILTLDPGGATLRIAAHQAAVPRDRLVQIGRAVRRQADAWRIAHVLVEPFQGGWEPSLHTLRLSLAPPRTILNALSEKGFPVETFGGIDEAFAHSGITRAHAVPARAGILEQIEAIWRSPQNGLVFARLEHPGNPARCARALEEFDRWLAGFIGRVENDDLVIITGSNDGRERQEVPVLLRYGGRAAPLGVRTSFADVAMTLDAYFGLSEHGRPWPLGEPMAAFHRRVFGGL